MSRAIWVNVYRGGWLGAHWSRDFADSAALACGVPREACVERSFENGEGLPGYEPTCEQIMGKLHELSAALLAFAEADPPVSATGVAPASADRPVASLGAASGPPNNDHEDDGA